LKPTFAARCERSGAQGASYTRAALKLKERTMTRRERLAANVEKREKWASGANAAAAGIEKQAERFRGDVAFNTQPGHIPERARLIRRQEKGFELRQKADHHKAKASALADVLDRSIFSDDQDAIEQLEARIAEREASRERIKAYNKSCRAAAKKDEQFGDVSLLDTAERADLTTTASVCPEQLGKGGSFPSYKLTNLGALILADRKRIEEIRRRAKRTEEAEAAGGLVIRRNPEHDFCTVTFADRPDRNVLDALRAAGFWFGKGSWAGKTENLPQIVLDMEAQQAGGAA
jgi:Domain of unknown function (DUF3560)